VQSRQYEFAHYYKTKNYIGSAGGFRRGMAIAHENGFDWVWLLDQDSTVSPNCLIALLKCAKKGDLLCPNIRDRDRPFYSRPSAHAKNVFGSLYPITLCSFRCKIQTFGMHVVLISKKRWIR
jgi:GT2 family glycosyltransferase